MTATDIEVTRGVQLQVRICPTCGVLFAMPKELVDNLYQDGGYFYCPNGHGRGWDEGRRERDKKSAENRIAVLQSQLDQVKASNRQLADDVMTKAKELKSMKKRAEATMCPHCRRTFATSRMQRHLATKHKETA